MPRVIWKYSCEEWFIFLEKLLIFWYYKRDEGAGARDATPKGRCPVHPAPGFVYGGRKVTGVLPGLQNLCGAGKAVPGGFDSHMSPPEIKKASDQKEDDAK